MISAIISLLVFIVPVAIFLLVQMANMKGRSSSHWPQPKKAPETQSAPPIHIRRKARVRAAATGPDCGRQGVHLLLAVTGARDSCKHCAALRGAEPETQPASPTDVLAEAERIVNEARDQS